MRRITLLPVIFALCFGPIEADLSTGKETATKHLLEAVEKNDPQTVRAALKDGALINGPGGPTALFKAVEYKKDEEKQNEIVLELLKHGADINAVGPDGDSVFQQVMEGKALCGVKVVALMAEYNPDLTYRNSDGDSVLARALQRGGASYVQKNLLRREPQSTNPTKTA